MDRISGLFSRSVRNHPIDDGRRRRCGAPDDWPRSQGPGVLPCFRSPGDQRPDSASAGDDKTLNEQEERRLFYVAMTRARDSLRIYGKQGIGKDKTPAGLMRELIGNAALQPSL